MAEYTKEDRLPYAQSASRHYKNYQELIGVRKEYLKYLEPLESIKTSIDFVTKQLVWSSNDFLNGGYVDNGESIDRGRLTTFSSKSESISETLQSLIDYTSQTESTYYDLAKEEYDLYVADWNTYMSMGGSVQESNSNV